MTLTTPIWRRQFVITGLLRAGGKTPYPPPVGKHGASQLYLGPPTLYMLCWYWVIQRLDYA